jgi:hypothetical protein
MLHHDIIKLCWFKHDARDFYANKPDTIDFFVLGELFRCWYAENEDDFTVFGDENEMNESRIIQWCGKLLFLNIAVFHQMSALIWQQKLILIPCKCYAIPNFIVLYFITNLNNNKSDVRQFYCWIWNSVNIKKYKINISSVISLVKYLIFYFYFVWKLISIFIQLFAIFILDFS